MAENSELENLINELTALKKREEELRSRIATFQPPRHTPKNKNSEEIIGINVLSKIGICVIVIGLIALVKFLFDKGLLSTAAKITVEYSLSAAAVFFAYKNKENRKILSSILITGGISFAYSLTFVCQHYFEIFSAPTALIISLLIAVFATAAGFFYSKPLFGFSLLTVFFAPIFSGYNINEDNFWGWTAFSFVLVSSGFALSYFKKTRAGLNAAFKVAVVFVITTFLDAPDHSRNFWLFFTIFALFYSADILLKQKHSEDKFYVIYNTANTLLAIFCFCAIDKSGYNGAYYDFVLSGCFLITVLFLKQNLHFLSFAVFTFDLGVFLILCEHKNVHLTALLIAIEAIIFLLAYKKTAKPFFENTSFNLTAISLFSTVLVLTFYENGHQHTAVLNSAFFTMMILTNIYFLLSVNFENNKFSSYAQLFVFIAFIVAVEIEIICYSGFHHHILLSLLTAVYALGVFVLGVKKDKKLLRYFAVILAGLTAVKIICIDVMEQSLALKAAVFIAEGGIFLLISYLYSKFLKGNNYEKREKHEK